jgi:PhoPQ-activated pathogenicity-related protein
VTTRNDYVPTDAIVDVAGLRYALRVAIGKLNVVSATQNLWLTDNCPFFIAAIPVIVPIDKLRF